MSYGDPLEDAREHIGFLEARLKMYEENASVQKDLQTANASTGNVMQYLLGQIQKLELENKDLVDDLETAKGHASCPFWIAENKHVLKRTIGQNRIEGIDRLILKEDMDEN